MNRVKYISLDDLKKQLPEVIEDVYRYNVEYIVMINKEPKVRIIAIDKRNGKEVVIEERVTNRKLKEFVE